MICLVVVILRSGWLCFLSGDQEAPTQALAKTLDIEHYFANTLPENKANLISELQQQGRSICFIGDGINDSIALKQANVSVSLRGATAIATETAQVVLMDGNLSQLITLFQTAEQFEANMKQNLLISTVPATVCLIGILFFHWGVLTGITITLATLFFGVTNAIWPLLNQQIPSHDTQSLSCTK
ncbi:MAG: HAD-IC family P-type ATPase [Pseudomonadota bacterium]